MFAAIKQFLSAKHQTDQYAPSLTIVLSILQALFFSLISQPLFELRVKLYLFFTCHLIHLWYVSQGMFIVSFPYTVLQGGYWAVFAMVLVAYICCHTGNILVDCLYDLDPLGHKVRVRSSYVDIAAAVWGPRFGARIVHCAQVCSCRYFFLYSLN